MTLVIDIAGKTFGMWTVLERGPNAPNKKARWLCQCVCGKQALVPGVALRIGVTRSCIQCARQAKPSNLRHGHARVGRLRSPEYMIWATMIARCTNPKAPRYGYYGGRDIRVCDRWRRFEDFLEDMGSRPSPKHSIDRIDNSSDYHPLNCVWATKVEQMNNRRNNHRIPYNGKTQTISKWAVELGLALPTLSQRLKRGMSIEDAFNVPRRRRNAAA